MNLDKLEEFLNSHGYTGDAAEATSNQISDSSDIPTDVESTQGQDAELLDGLSSIQAQQLPSAVPQSEQPKLDFSNIKQMSDRRNFRKKLPN